MRLIDRLVVALLLAMVGWGVVAAIGARLEGASPSQLRPPIASPPVPAPPQAGPLLPPAGRADPPFGVELPPRVQDSVGTAFAIDANGTWLTARHVVEGCARVLLRRDGRWVPVQVAWRHPRADLVALRGPGGAALPAFDGPLHVGQQGFGIGFPRGAPGAIVGALLGRSTMHVEGRFAGSASVTTWAELLRDPPDPESGLGGISGGPLLDSRGRVIGVVVASTIRRGRFHAVAPELLAEAGLRATPGAPSASVIDSSNYVSAAARLRQQQSVLQAGCQAPRV